MKRLLLVTTCLVAIGSMTSAHAADLAPVRKAPPPPAAAFSWTGTYVGVHLGGVWGHGRSTVLGFPTSEDVSPALPAAFSHDSGGLIGGAQTGSNYQIGNWVIGAESDISLTTLKPKTEVTGAPFAYSDQQRLDWFGTTRARLGYTPMDRLMVYATGGLAYGHVKSSSALAGSTAFFSGADSDLRVGWAAGAGIEYAITDNLWARVEYLHYDLGSTTVVGFPSPATVPALANTHFGLSGDMVRAGLNYRMDLLSFAAGIVAPAAPAAGMVTKAPATSFFSGFTVETGLRYWYSSGKTKYDLFGFAGDGRVSRLTYDGLDGHAAESFFRVDHAPTNLFVKGFFGTGALGNGKLTDEDFPPVTTPYSATVSSQKNGTINYLAADLGYTFLRGGNYRVGAFVGYHYYDERLNAMGCRQIATSDICNDALGVDPSVSTDFAIITQKARWHSVRLGVTGDLLLTDRLKLTADAAWLPYTSLTARDFHWLRINPTDLLGPIAQDGTGHSGVQLEALLSYQVTPAFSLGAGGRYWRMATEGHAQFPIDAPKQALKFETERFGGFVQGAFKF